MLSSVRVSEDPRTTRTRALLVDAFMALLYEKGFNAITVQDVAARATVNRATFYAHFDDKYALFAHATRVGFIDMAQQQVSMTDPYSQDQLRQLIGSLCAFLAQLKQACARSFREFESMIATEVVAGVETILNAWAAQQKCDGSYQQADWEVATSISSWGMYGVARSWILGQRPEPVEQFTERVIPLIAPIIEVAVAAS